MGCVEEEELRCQMPPPDPGTSGWKDFVKLIEIKDLVMGRLLSGKEKTGKIK